MAYAFYATPPCCLIPDEHVDPVQPLLQLHNPWETHSPFSQGG